MWSKLPPRSASRSVSSKIVHVPVPQILEEAVELLLCRFWTARFVVKTAPRSGVSTEATVRVTCRRRIVERIFDGPAPPILEVIVEVVSLTSATANRRANRGCAYSTEYGDNCRGS